MWRCSQLQLDHGNNKDNIRDQRQHLPRQGVAPLHWRKMDTQWVLADNGGPTERGSPNLQTIRAEMRRARATDDSGHSEELGQ